jgi:hypothetical protein
MRTVSRQISLPRTSLILIRSSKQPSRFSYWLEEANRDRLRMIA